MQKWANNIKNIQEDRRIKLVIIAANNHYARFAPGTVNIFRSMLGLPKAKWQDREDGLEDEQQQQQYPAQDFKQRTLSDFMMMNDDESDFNFRWCTFMQVPITNIAKLSIGLLRYHNNISS